MALTGNPTRAQLAQVFTDPRTRLAMEALFEQANDGLPAQVAEALQEAPTAKAEADALLHPEYIVAEPSGTVPNSRKLTGDTGVSIDLTTAAIAKIVVDVIAILGYTPVN